MPDSSLIKKIAQNDTTTRCKTQETRSKTAVILSEAPVGQGIVAEKDLCIDLRSPLKTCGDDMFEVSLHRQTRDIFH